jgi:hypothetical protein
MMLARRRRTNDPISGPRRRREDELEELLAHGSRNFRQYRRRAIAGFVILMLGTAAALAGIVDGQRRNRTAIRVSCTLLANAIIESGGAQTNGPQAQLTALYVSVIRRAMTPAETRQAANLAKQIPARTGLTIPDCERIAEHPLTVRAVPLPAPAPMPTPSKGGG